MIRQLKSKDKRAFTHYLLTKGDKDFYITKDNMRIIPDNFKIINRLFNDVLKRSDKCYISESKGIINGLLLVVGYSDKAPRKYVKILADNKQMIDKLFKVLVWNIKDEVYIKITRENPISWISQKYKFIFCGNRGKEILLKRYRILERKNGK